MRANEVRMRAFLKVRDETSSLSKLVSILRCLPDGILIADMNQALYFNQKVKHLLQIFESDEDTNSHSSYSRVRISKSTQRQI
jgi:hypothetical protein